MWVKEKGKEGIMEIEEKKKSKKV
jgi:hypothetical protein